MYVLLISFFFSFFFFFFNDTATTEIYTLSLHDALPIADALEAHAVGARGHVDDRARDEHLATRRPRHHARGLVDLAPVVVAVAVEGLAVVDADARRRLSPVDARLQSHRPARERRRVGAHDHDLVAE